MAIILTDQELINAKRDIDDIGKAVNKKEVVHPRYGDSFKSLPMIVDEFQISSDAAESAAVSAAESAGIAQSSSQIAQDSAALAELAATAATIGGKVYNTPESGVDPVTGVADGAYYNVRSSSGESYVDEYQNVGGSAVATGKSYPSSNALNNIPHNNLKDRDVVGAHPASAILDASGVSQQEINDSLSGLDEKIDREFVSVWDFFTASQMAAYKASPTTFDASDIIQSFFNHIAANDVGVAYFNGDFRTTKSLILGGQAGCKTKQIIGRVTLTYFGSGNLGTMLTLQAGEALTWTGGIQLNAAPSIALNYAVRKVDNGVRIGGAYTCRDLTIDYIYCNNGFKQWGIILDNLTTATKIKKTRHSRSGSGYQGYYAGYDCSEHANYTFLSHFEGSLTQYSVISADNIPDFSKIEGVVQAYISGELYWITVGDTTGTLKTYPKLANGVTSGVLDYVWGGGFLTKGGDASVTTIGSINAGTCSYAMLISALYPPYVEALTTQENLIGLGLGASRGAGLVGGTMGILYVEGNTYSVVQNTGYATNFRILNTSALLDVTRMRAMADYRAVSGDLARLYGVTATIRLWGTELKQRQLSVDGAAVSVELAPFQDYNQGDIFVTAAADKVLNLSVQNTAAFNIFKWGSRRVVLSGPNGNYTGKVTINPPDGILLNNSTNPITLNNLSGVTILEFNMVASNRITMALVGNRKAIFTFNPPSIPAGEKITQNFTLTGVEVGDNLSVAFSQYNADVDITAVVSASNTVTVKFHNTGSASVDLPSGNLTVRLL